MLSNAKAMATVPVKDIETARTFYENTLGLHPADSQESGTLMYASGSFEVLVYESEYAGTNQATAVTWMAADVENEVQNLKSRGVRFEHYDLPGVTRKGDVHVIRDDLKNAWFKDPDGNIHAVVGS